MKFALPLTAILCIFFHSSSAAIGSARVIGMHDKESEQYKDAARTLLRAIAKGDKDAAKAAFASEGDDLKLLELTIATNSALQQLFMPRVTLR